MSVLLTLIAAVGAAGPSTEAVKLLAASQQECRRAGSTNGARVGRSICKTADEWIALERSGAIQPSSYGRAFPSINPGPGDPNNRTAFRSNLFIGNKGGRVR